MAIGEPRSFVLTKEHVILLRNSWIDDLVTIDSAARLDQKRPYGTKSIIMSAAELLDVKTIETYEGEEVISRADGERVEKIHNETGVALQVILSSGSFKLGLYQTSGQYVKDWRLVEEHTD